ncbi:class I SAM-dependent methyltransferase [Actinomadura kijaniata]|uniref:Cyclopropane-fatty-acyl-phospholipid synthase n=1 Tax=Actinomadura namibiensis TaxID=182080 RepID=A0A7W3LP46_ACTNM|nr:class I SAM-dependent methyltransferase [Actinomadura namibiensis]MBA8951662.1 cyclopropane-fatty-acyl-phospholipid synthase [Actinomadura namibiensis]
MTLARVFERLAGAGAPVEFTAYDGSRAGVNGADLRFHVRSPHAVSYLVHSPGALGLARAYVSGMIDVSGDMYTVLSTMQQVLGEVSAREKARVLSEVLRDPLLRGAVSRRLDPPPQEAPFSRVPSWLRHSKRRDAKAISHHYDVSNTFYEWVLGPSMAYTCACFPEEHSTLEEAQFHKHDLVAKKLGLEPGMRLLDVGCGWGGMVMHAAKEYGVKALGVTLSKQQAEWAQKAIADRGLSDLAEVRHMDYRDVAETGFDAVSSIGLTEHIGKANLPSYFSFLYDKLKPYGRMLNHTITRPDNLAPPIKQDGFINRYVFPDGELEGPGYIQSQMNDAGFEIRHQENLREHYARTLRGWCDNLEDHWDEAVAEVGEGTARVWRVYMAGCVLGFEQNWIQLHQTLGVKLDDKGDARMPLRPDWGV